MTDKPKLTPANENPWYVLMTLYGEQDEEEVVNDPDDQSRAVWNAWSCQQLYDDAAAELAKQTGVDVAETRGWSLIATEVKRKHRAEMEDRNDDDFTYPGFPDFESAIQCSEIQFCNILVLENRIFTQPVYFTSATFTQDADFNSATFTQDANFSSATFTQSAYFDSATFTQLAYFFSATFTQRADFLFATFTQDADFSSATFTQAADFSSATFDGPAKFMAARFGVRDETETCVPIFTEAAFARLVSFRDAKFVTHYPVLEGTEFRETLVVTAKSTHWPSAGQPLLDQAAKVLRKVPTKEVAKDSCARLRHALGKQGMPEDEHFFYRREMKLAGAIDPWNRGFPYRLFGWVSDYGYSIARPANALLALWLWIILVYTEGGGFGVFEALGYSFANMFKFFGLQSIYFDYEIIRNWPAWVKVVSATQTVLSFILLFFLGLGLRTRFRLR
ncbi:hypothetical protein OA238_c33500 [Octadecabacter arcticus 238]|uniref:Pentapeptide repeat-containing protein n=1 Tax=Octadecabacter arcticus 238 TaxID=391616 RepID=M9RS88_9RHOB|nr:pentapeptide repeat-containing protein [Octadecabacter arcticus]AGI73331.1 hypothetical protein OA238_c33500 [Octadecabacter arcticus 238]